MPELRYNLVARDWVIIATERAKRPEDFASKPHEAASSDSAINCPFCPGKESKTPAELFAVRDNGSRPNTPGWEVRVTENAFPALRFTGEPTRNKTPAGFTSMNGFGQHEVIIESPDHNQVIATMPLKHVEKIFSAYQQRYQALAQDKRFESIILFKNHGCGAGTSLSHPHSQLIALPIIPQTLRSRFDIGLAHFDELGTCLYCDLIKMEKTDGVRLVAETDNFIAFVPYAPHMPFETWIVPKFHQSNFENVSPKHCRELAAVTQTVLGKLYRAINNPDFNFAIYSAPCQAKDVEYFHWSLKIFPRLANLAGFEVGSGVMINTVIPEVAAKYLRDA